MHSDLTKRHHVKFIKKNHWPFITDLPSSSQAVAKNGVFTRRPTQESDVRSDHRSASAAPFQVSDSGIKLILHVRDHFGSLHLLLHILPHKIYLPWPRHRKNVRFIQCVSDLTWVFHLRLNLLRKIVNIFSELRQGLHRSLNCFDERHDCLNLGLASLGTSKFGLESLR